MDDLHPAQARVDGLGATAALGLLPLVGDRLGFDGRISLGLIGPVGEEVVLIEVRDPLALAAEHHPREVVELCLKVLGLAAERGVLGAREVELQSRLVALLSPPLRLGHRRVTLRPQFLDRTRGRCGDHREEVAFHRGGRSVCVVSRC